MSGSSSTNSTVIMLPTLSSGYCSRLFIVRRVSGPTFSSSCVTKFAGISPRKSAASSANSSSKRFAISVLEKVLISS